MKTLLKITDIIKQWQFIAQEYCQSKENLPLRVIINKSKEKIHAEIFNIITNDGENEVILVTEHGPLIINENNQWALYLGQTAGKKTIFTKNLNKNEEE